MAVREYVGARYVPRFRGTYDNTIQYDAMDVVDNGVGTSYIATKTVPAGTPLINTNYWFVYGAASGAVYDLQTRMTAAENNITTAQGNITALQNGVNAINSAIAANMNNHKYIVLGDSFGNGITGMGTRVTGWLKYITDLFPAGKVYNQFSVPAAIGAGVTGFNSTNKHLTNLTWITENVIQPAGDELNITDIVVISGTNDINYQTGLADAIDAFVSYCRTHFPKARIAIGCAGSNMQGLRPVRSIYRNAAYANGCEYLGDLDCIFQRVDFINTDGTHYTEAGYQYVNPTIVSCVINGHADWATAYVITFNSGAISVIVTVSNRGITFSEDNVNQRLTYPNVVYARAQSMTFDNALDRRSLLGLGGGFRLFGATCYNDGVYVGEVDGAISGDDLKFYDVAGDVICKLIVLNARKYFIDKAYLFP